jgi:hypothetical protein
MNTPPKVQQLIAAPKCQKTRGYWKGGEKKALIKEPAECILNYLKFC